MTITQEISLDLTRENTYKTIMAKQNDQNSRFLKITVLSGGEEIKINKESNVVFTVCRSDGECKPFRGEVDDDGAIIVLFPNWMLQTSGVAKCSISIIDISDAENAARVSSLDFTVLIERSSYNNEEIVDDDRYDILTDLIIRTETIWDNLSDFPLKAGEGADSVVQRYTDEVDENHYGNTNTGKRATVLGEASNNTGDRALLAGFHIKNSNDDAGVLGRYNLDKGGVLFEVGNGTSSEDRKNAFEVLEDGRATVQSAPIEDNDVVRKAENDKKYDKTGGIISGDVAIQGNLSVTGTTTTKDTETLLVKDNIMVANTDGIELINNAGFAIMTNKTTTYGIMYNPIDDGVMIGEGTIDETGEFTYIEGEAQYLATVDWTIPSGNIPKWDSTKRTFVDSGEKIEEKANRAELLQIVRLVE